MWCILGQKTIIGILSTYHLSKTITTNTTKVGLKRNKMAEDLARAIVVAAHIMENEEKQRAQEEEYVPEAVLYLVNNYGYGKTN